MRNFEEKKQEYFKRLEKCEELVLRVSINKKNKQIVEILLNPKKEKELNFANKYLMFMQDYMKLTENSMNENIEEIDFNNCVFTNYLSSLINNNTSENELETFKISWKDINLSTEISYQAIVVANSPSETIDEIIMNKCNIDINNKINLIKFSILVNSILETCVPSNITDENDMEMFINYADKFHKLCVKGIKSKYDDLLNIIINSDKQKKIKM